MAACSSLTLYSYNCLAGLSPANCMSGVRYTPTKISRLHGPFVPLDTGRHINNYFLLRSFSQNWTQGCVSHIPIPRPAIRDIAAGEHHFEWKAIGNPIPVVTVTFLCAPCIHTHIPICHASPHPEFKQKNIYVFFFSVPDTLPHFVEDKILEVGSHLNEDISPFVDFLDSFIEDFYRPVTPLGYPSPPLLEFE